MTEKSITINIAKIITYPVCTYLCITGKVSWWTFLAIVLISDCNFDITYGRKIKQSSRQTK